MDIAIQTKIAGIGYMFLLSAYIILLSGMQAPARNKLMVNFVALALAIPIALYGLNCAIVGNCQTYAWLYSYVIISWGMLFALMTLFAIFKLI